MGPSRVAELPEILYVSLRQCWDSGKDSSDTEQLFCLGVLPLPCVWLLHSVLGPLPDLGSSRTLVPSGCANLLPSEEDTGCPSSCMLTAISVIIHLLLLFFPSWLHHSHLRGSSVLFFFFFLRDGLHPTFKEVSKGQVKVAIWEKRAEKQGWEQET